MITSVEILKIVKNTEVTPTMQRAICTQVSTFFAKAETHVIDYKLYDKVKAYKSFNIIEKAKIAYETLSRLYAGIVFNEGFLDHWEEELREFLEEIEMESVENSSVVQTPHQNYTVETVCHSEPSSEESNPQMQVVGFISYGDLNIRVLKKADFFNDDILAELGA